MIFGHPKNVSRPQNRFSGPWNMNILESRFQKLKNIKKMEPVLLKILCRLDYTLLQTGSWESKIMKNRFGWKFKNIVKMYVIGNTIGNTIGNHIKKRHFQKWHVELNMKWKKLIRGFPGLLNTLGALLDRSRTILQTFKIL